MDNSFEPFINMLSNEELKKIVHNILKVIVPNYFWEIAASSTGKYHPYFDNGYGGNVRHTIMCIRCAIDFLKKDSETTDPEFLDKVIVACILHDAFKRGIEDTGHTVHEHPKIAAEMFYKKLCEYDEKFAKEVTNAIASHMGRWTISSKSNVILKEPETKLDEIVSLADYVSSRKYVLYMPEGDF